MTFSVKSRFRVKVWVTAVPDLQNRKEKDGARKLTTDIFSSARAIITWLVKRRETTPSNVSKTALPTLFLWW